ncbi:hypothetical protein C8Q74DRAFT_1434838 [Fomes fomentarius]|nr:hypothetical protein C8Q74DRAFT_1434838 [Fomes fomentarius]
MSDFLASCDVSPLAKGYNQSRAQHTTVGSQARVKVHERRIKAALDNANKTVGEMPQAFCDHFFPFPSDPKHPRPVIEANPFERLENADDMLEADLTKIFIEIVNERNLAPGLVLRYCGDRPDPGVVDPEGNKIDAGFYSAPKRPRKKKKRIDYKKKKYRASWGDQRIGIELKRGEAHNDPFHDTESGVVPTTNVQQAVKVRGQILAYAELLMAIQQRLAVFMLFIIGRRCRLMRFDRSGSIVTHLVDYFVEWEFFCDILWRISQCSDSQLGYDPTAERLSPRDADYKEMDRLAKADATDLDHKERVLGAEDRPQDGYVFAYVREMFADSLVKCWPRYRLQVPDGDNVRHFLVGKPTFRAKGLAGRATRGYVALDCTTKRFVWLKDKEGDVLAQLNASHVCGVPTLLCHGDIEEQDTVTPTWYEQKKAEAEHTGFQSHGQASSSSSSGQKRKREFSDRDDRDELDDSHNDGLQAIPGVDSPLRRHRHYRLVVIEVALPLSKFAYGQQLLAIIRDAVIAHHQATTKVGILHRDVSGGNILILPVYVENQGGNAIAWRGILADWEMSKPLNGSGQPDHARQPERTGTWQYMSVALLTGPKIVEVCDEVESFAYVILYYAVRYLRSNCDDLTVASFINDFFDTFGIENGTYICGSKKESAVESGKVKISRKTELSFDSPMDKMLSTCFSWFRAHSVVCKYKLYPEDKSKRQPCGLSPPSSAEADDVRAPSFDPSLLDIYNPDPTDVEEENECAGPSLQDQQLSKKVEDQVYMIRLLTTAIQRPSWNRADKVGDRVPPNWTRAARSLQFPAVHSVVVSTGSKRPKLDGLPSGTDANGSDVQMSRALARGVTPPLQIQMTTRKGKGRQV